MAELDPRTALEQARTMQRYVDAFNGQKFDPTFDEPDRLNLATALDNLQETAAMLLNMAGRVASPPAPAGQAEGANYPPLPGSRDAYGNLKSRLFTASQMYAFLDADRASRLPPVVQQAPVQPAGAWPFVETPGEFAARLQTALNYFGAVLPAVRNVLIECPAQLATSQPAAQSAVTDEQILKTYRDAIEHAERCNQGFSYGRLQALRAVLALATQAERPAVKEENHG